MEQRNEEQYFRLIGYGWDVGAILDYIEENNDNIVLTEQDPNIFNNLIGFIGIEKEYAMTTDISKPGIIVEYKPGEHMLIDGWHRTWKAKNEGKKMNYYLLNYEQQKPFAAV
ncbi:hypothetical protein D3C81_763300 [compost metagenome]